MTENKTKQELMDEAKKVQEDISRLQKIVDASSETTFEIILEDLKVQMIENVNNEAWNTLKANIREVDSIKGTQDFIAKQSTLLGKKKDELKELNDKINNFQCGLFDNIINKETKAEATGFKKGDMSITLGDVYKLAAQTKDSKDIYYLIVKTKKGRYAFVNSMDSKSELELNYPANLLVIQRAEYIGNVHIEDCDHEKAMEALNIIYPNNKNDSENEGKKEK